MDSHIKGKAQIEHLFKKILENRRQEKPEMDKIK